MIKVYQIPYEQFEQYWPHIEGYMERAAKYTYGRYEAEDIRELLAENNCELWAALNPDHTVEGAAITTVKVYPRLNTLDILFCAGVNGHQWKKAILAELRKYAKLNKCSRLEATARFGWLGYLKNDGCVKRSVMFELPV
jgi:hypothetical protein